MSDKSITKNLPHPSMTASEPNLVNTSATTNANEKAKKNHVIFKSRPRRDQPSLCVAHLAWDAQGR